MIYYELGQGEASQFHTLDADEYWFFHAGSTLELWEIDNAKLTKYKLGLEDGAEPCVLMKAGTIFSERNTFLQRMRRPLYLVSRCQSSPTTTIASANEKKS